ncbi:hypothetical protein [Larkinella sp. C7]|uniref:hypothetical protein n=1 Tax=Larkinella sp. C7 TaxID=2576607 RepID=UPI0011115E02|nr:hypothetical protein [Larkinella sp. C7]
MINTTTENLGYLVRWDAPHRPHEFETNQQVFSHPDLLTARRQAFRFAEDLCQNQTGKYTLEIEIYLVHLIMEPSQPALKAYTTQVFHKRYPEELPEPVTKEVTTSSVEKKDQTLTLTIVNIVQVIETEKALLEALSELDGELRYYEQHFFPTGFGTFAVVIRHPTWINEYTIAVLYDALAYVVSLIGRYNHFHSSEGDQELTLTVVQQPS